MDDRNRVALSMLLGAALGGALGYLFLTPGGRAVREEMEPALDDLIDEMRRMRRAVEKARSAADEGLQAFSDLVGEVSDAGRSRRDPATRGYGSRHGG